MRKHTPRPRTALVLAAVLALPAVPPPAAAAPAAALPAGFFFLLNSVKNAQGQFLGMDAHSAAGQVTGNVHLNPAKTGRTSQQWKQRFPRTGSQGVIRLENRLTGTCIADAVGNSAAAVLRPCSDPTTLWTVYHPTSSSFAFARTTRITGPFPNIRVCLGRSAGRTSVFTLPCNDSFSLSVQWKTAKAT
ncbi:hypothetical protein [Planomonospora parontospora]|uniref:hypothetical protein n=1 Tax=Planomonospora parontospora TaxID=58119 RepID=UPI001670D8B0|nr:hypothetical protein [Planomonospora parontospora]GGL30656.1 hypothetical protein GCM10014719_35000 [Planomonospora parontospora subsp. antibiotica]GII16687.1 hypothetical protein Ppa05_34130 [Planomonospora parontospora subsp. antibiotica]